MLGEQLLDAALVLRLLLELIEVLEEQIGYLMRRPRASELPMDLLHVQRCFARHQM